MKRKVRIGCGAGFSGDRLEPAVILAEKGELDYLVLECLAERTIALAQKRKALDPEKGYDPLLEKRLDLLLPIIKKNNIRLITNMGAANPIAALKKVIEIARSKAISIKVAAIIGDDVYELISGNEIAIETNKPLKDSGQLISANAYLGADAILAALQTDANVIITGRVADPSLFLAPLIHEFNWDINDMQLMGKGTVVGHLLECAGQISGGYFADPIKKLVENMSELGHPFVDVFEDGSAIVSKVKGTGGHIDLATAKEQLLYEVTDPHEYYTPDVIADFTTVCLTDLGEDRVKVTGGGGKNKPSTLKVSVGYKAGFIGEGEISYAGPSAIQRAQLAGEIIKQRLGSTVSDLKIDYIGCSSLHQLSVSDIRGMEPYEIRLRVAGKMKTGEEAARIGEEVEALYTNGPAGGGGVRKYVNEVVGIVSTLINRVEVYHSVIIEES
ncbi:acyclic terpene utilization AtuA family protein [Albibacterium sp.]|uniref:acyclic terpene utilization AtuA family protein n=1 Tax=Albibacterium sp. TaxID=2952885 RepID=UPI002C258D43|nr:acyclic terpene utilization AtuA family protein [Albibacterium sp.]HUH18877.1 acyclic terpene utilization AtuA family protein [Albibacterium sp.]